MVANSLGDNMEYPVKAKYSYPDGQVKVKTFVYESDIKAAEEAGIKIEIIEGE